MIGSGNETILSEVLDGATGCSEALGISWIFGVSFIILFPTSGITLTWLAVLISVGIIGSGNETILSEVLDGATGCSEALGISGMIPISFPKLYPWVFKSTLELSTIVPSTGIEDMLDISVISLFGVFSSTILTSWTSAVITLSEVIGWISFASIIGVSPNGFLSYSNK